MERPEVCGDGTETGAAAVGGSDWVIVGDVPGTIFSVFMWYRLLMTFYPNGRKPEDPFFMARDRSRAYTYTSAQSDLHSHLERHGLPRRGCHGIRVGAYNKSKETNGEELTVAQGGWHSSAHYRYSRFVQRDVASIPARMVGEESQYYDETARPTRPVERETVVRGETSAAEAVPRDADPLSDVGWSSDDDGFVSRRIVRRRPSPPREVPAITRARGKARAEPEPSK